MLSARQCGIQHEESKMEPKSLSRFLHDYLSGQRPLFGIDPQEALSRLNEVMQWGDEKKDGRDEPAASGGTRD